MQQDTLEALCKEASELKSKIEEERNKFKDTDLANASDKVEAISTFSMKSRRVLKGHQGKVLAMDWCVDRKRLVSASYDGKLIIWNAFTSSKDHIINIAATWQMACSYSPSTDMVAAGGLDNKCTVYPLPGQSTNELIDRKKTVAIHTSYVSCCKFLHSENQILTASGDSTCALWDVDSGTMIHSFRGHLGDATCLDYPSFDMGNIFVSGGCDRAAYVWDMRVGSWVQMFDTHEGDINAIRFYPAGDAFVTGSDDASCRLYDLRADRELAVYAKDSVMFGCNATDFSLSGRLLFAGYNDFAVNVWDVLKLQRVTLVYAHENRISCLQVSPDGTAVCTGSWDQSLKIWA